MADPTPDPGARKAAELRDHGLRLLERCTRKLAKLAGDPDAGMAISAVQSLGKIGSPSTASDLFELLPTERVAEEAVRALARIDHGTVGPRLVKALTSAVPAVQSAICSVLWQYPRDGVLDTLVPFTKSPQPLVRRAAAASLGKLGDPAARPALVAAFDDPVEDVMMAAWTAFSNLPRDDAEQLVSIVSERFDATASAKVRATMVQVLTGLEGESVLALMKKALKDENARVRANSVEVVAAMALPEKRKLGILKPLVVDGQNNRVMGNLAIAFGEIDPKASMQILSGLLNSPEKWERASAVYAARHVRSDRIAGWLTTIFTTEADADVLRNVIESLSFFSGEEVTACFVRALGHGNAIVRSGAVQSLARLNEPAAEGNIVKLLEKEEDLNVICEALTALGKLSEPARIPIVSRYLQHTDLRVQANAIEALMHIGSVEIIPHVEPFLNSSDNRVKANAALALWRSGNLIVVDELEGMLDGPNIKQRSSAVYAVGEVGEALRDLENLQRYLLLVSALNEDLERSRRDDPGITAVPATPEAAPPPSAFEEPDLPLEKLEQALALIAAGKPDAAISFLDGVSSSGDSNPYLGFLQADLHRRRGELEPAIARFEAVNASAGPFVHSHLHLANLHNKNHQIPSSLSSYFSALESQIRVLTDEIELGKRLIREDRVNDASLLLKDLVRKMAIDTKIHHTSGNELLRCRDYEAAYRQLARAYITEPRSADLVFSLAVACYKTSRMKEARLLCRKLETAFPGEPLFQKKALELTKLIDRSVPPG